MLYDLYRLFPPGLRVAGTQYFPYFDPITQRLGLLAQLGIFRARPELGVNVLFGLSPSRCHLRQNLISHRLYGRCKTLTLLSQRLYLASKVL